MHTYIHTYRQTDRQTDIHTYIHRCDMYIPSNLYTIEGDAMSGAGGEFGRPRPVHLLWRCHGACGRPAVGCADHLPWADANSATADTFAQTWGKHWTDSW